MTPEELRETRAAVLFLDRNPSAPLHDVVTVLVRDCPSLGYELLSVLLGDWAQQFRLENQAEIDSALLRALEARAA